MNSPQEIAEAITEYMQANDLTLAEMGKVLAYTDEDGNQVIPTRDRVFKLKKGDFKTLPPALFTKIVLVTGDSLQ